MKLEQRHEIASQIQHIRKQVCHIKERRDAFSFRSSEQGSSSGIVQNVTWHDPRQASLFIKETELVGIEEPKKKLLRWLLEGESKQGVISVVGMGGLGKTTLAKKAFDSQEVKGHFDCNAWISVSQSYKMEEILRKTMKQFKQASKEESEEIDKMEEEQLIGKLQEYLLQKKYFVVFDDVWEIDFWGVLKFALPSNAIGSRVIFTTRSGDVASSTSCEESSTHVLELQPLPPEKAWELFCKKVFRSDSCPEEFEELAHEIVNKCQGLPLAIVVIGGLLSRKSRVASEWKTFHDSLRSELDSNCHLESIMRILLLSYYDLPYHLKSCFLYLGVFPEDYRIRRGRLIRLWIAEGFVKETEGKTVEDIAKEYFNELTQRRLVLIPKVDFDGRARECQVHDLIREIILSKYIELNFCRVLEKNKKLSFDGLMRRLSMHDYEMHILKSTNFSKVRSISLFGVNDLVKQLTGTILKNSPRRSSVLEISLLKELNVSSSPRKGLDHCITAPVGSHRNMLIEGQEFTFSRSMTEKEPRRDLKLDRLSEREKQKLIVNLVKIQNDGTVEVDITKSVPVASELLELHAVEGAPINIDDTITGSNKSVPRLKIAMLVVGTRGDVQPFLAMAKRLQEFGHHVRLATHVNFRNFVRSAGVDFYPLGGDPRVLAGYMARNKGFIPSGPGEISIQRKQLKAIIESLLPACTEPDLDTGVPFRAQAIIGNPPAYGHAHVAEALGVPLHIFFTMPWTPTYEFPHPLARVPQTAGYWLSYIVVDLLIWWGVRGYINDFRKRKLKLPPIAYFSMYRGSISHLPTGYMWSPHLVPKPNDWGPSVDVVGYCFLNLGSKYQPREEFVQWIQKGPKPIYIGFGSMPLEDPKKTTDIILEALKDTGQRGIIDRGWGDLGIFPEVPDNVFLLEDCPHDWLFPQCSAVVHHGGAGTTATGLKAGCPTTIVPFFGDQFFWGDRIHQRGLGPAPIPISQLSIESLSDAIRFMLQPEVKSQAIELAKLIENEDGVAAAVDAFHRHLPPEVPMRPTASFEADEDPDPLQWFFLQIEKWCCLPCGS